MSPINAQLMEQCVTPVEKNNHFSRVYRAGTEKSSHNRTKTAHNMESKIDSLYIGIVNHDEKRAVCQRIGTILYETATIRGIGINIKLDTGADANVLPMCLYQWLPGHIHLQPTETVSIAFGGAHLPIDGIVSLECRTNNRKAVLHFHVSRHADKPIW